MNRFVIEFISIPTVHKSSFDATEAIDYDARLRRRLIFVDSLMVNDRRQFGKCLFCSSLTKLSLNSMPSIKVADALWESGNKLSSLNCFRPHKVELSYKFAAATGHGRAG